MKKKLLVPSVLLAFALGTLQAGDFWKEKGFQEWSKKEVERMLTKSPWAQRVVIHLRQANQIPRAGAGGLEGGAGGGPGPGGPGSPSTSGGFGGGGPSAGRGQGSGGFAPSLELTVRWYSARPIKEAVVRTFVGEDVEKSDSAAQLLSREERHYLIGILGLPSSLFETQDERAQEILEILKRQSFLKIKGKAPIAVEQVRIEKG